MRSGDANRKYRLKARIDFAMTPMMGAVWKEKSWFQQYRSRTGGHRGACRTGCSAGGRCRFAAALRWGFDVARIFEIDELTRHDVIAFTTVQWNRWRPRATAIRRAGCNYGLASTDVVDTAQALQLRAHRRFVVEGIAKLRET